MNFPLGIKVLARNEVTLRAIFRDVADILCSFGGIFRHGDTSINICAAGTGNHVTRPSATICEHGHVRHGQLKRIMWRHSCVQSLAYLAARDLLSHCYDVSLQLPMCKYDY